MPQLSVDLSNPLVQPEADAQVLGVIRLSNTERFSFYSLDAELIGRNEQGEVVSKQVSTLRMAGIVEANALMRAPFRFSFPPSDSGMGLTWEVVAQLYFKEGAPITAWAMLGQPIPLPGTLPVLPAPPAPKQTTWKRIEKAAQVPFAAFLITIGVAMLNFHPEAPPTPLAVLSMYGAICLLQGFAMWASFLQAKHQPIVRWLGTALSILFWGFVLKQLALLPGSDDVPSLHAQVSHYFAVHTFSHVAWAACLPILTLMVVFPWLKTPRDPYWIRSASYLFLLHNLCLLPIALLHAPSEWMNPIYVAGATNIFLLAYTANKLPWQHLTRPWIYASGLAILPSLVGLIVWDPVHGWMAGAGMVVVVGAYLAMALIHHHRISRFGEVKAQLLSTSAVRCERVSLLIEVTPPRSLELEEVRATLTCLRIVHQGGGRGGSSRHVEVHS